MKTKKRPMTSERERERGREREREKKKEEVEFVGLEPTFVAEPCRGKEVEKRSRRVRKANTKQEERWGG